MSWGGRSGFLRRLSWVRPSPALTTNPNGKATLLCKPGVIRPLSVKEYARIQQFPDTWVFEGSTSHKYIQIGNAVPIGLGKKLGVMIKSSMEGHPSLDRLGKVACDNKTLIDHISKRPKTILNPKRMRKVKNQKRNSDWFSGNGHNRNEIRGLLSDIPGKTSEGASVSKRNKESKNKERLSWKAHSVTRILHLTHGSPNHNNKKDPLDELVFIILSQMTTNQSYNRVFDRLKGKVGSWENVIDMRVSELKMIIKDAGLSNQKAPRIKRILGIIKDDFGKVNLTQLRGKTNEEVEKYLTSLPSVGLKTAKCVALYSLGREVLPIDTHVARLSNRLGFLSGRESSTARHVILEGIVPPSDYYAFHVNAMVHGQRICRPDHPLCNQCVLSQYCLFIRKKRDALN